MVFFNFPNDVVSATRDPQCPCIIAAGLVGGVGWLLSWVPSLIPPAAAVGLAGGLPDWGGAGAPGFGSDLATSDVGRDHSLKSVRSLVGDPPGDSENGTQAPTASAFEENHDVR